jgi:hypothetical protein
MVKANGGQLQIPLTTTAVGMEKKSSFPYFGYGSAWAEEMQGTCGDIIEIDLVTTETSKKYASRLPWHGFGFSWIKEGILTLKVSVA